VESEDCRLARLIVEGIVSDLNDRRGLGIDTLDDDVREAIQHAWYLLTLDLVRAAWPKESGGEDAEG